LILRFTFIAGGAISFPILAGMPPDATESLFRQAGLNIFGSLLFTSFWFFYLTQSVKVKDIYSA
jgi:hypothetical protein